MRGAAHDERAFGLEPAADVLLHDVEVLVAPTLRRGHAALGGRFSRHSVGSAIDEEGQWTLGILGREDDGLQANAVAHGDHDFLEVDGQAGLFGLCAEKRGECQRGE
jgi:hypothetical protein